MSTSDPLVAESHRKDLLIARLKADAFDLRQKMRDYDSLHEYYQSLTHKHNTMTDVQQSTQAELRSKLQYTSTSVQSLVREADALKEIHTEQLARLRTTNDELEKTRRISEQHYLQICKQKDILKNGQDRTLEIEREIGHKQDDFKKLEQDVKEKEEINAQLAQRIE